MASKQIGLVFVSVVCVFVIGRVVRGFHLQDLLGKERGQKEKEGGRHVWYIGLGTPCRGP